jgi:hypothetical protein
MRIGLWSNTQRFCRADILSERSDNVASKELTSCLIAYGDEAADSPI